MTATLPSIGQMLGELARTSAVGVALIGIDRRFIYVNEAMARINGISAERHVGAELRALLPGIAEQVDANLIRVAATMVPIVNDPVTGEVAARRGTWSVSYYPLGGEQLTAIGCVIADTTARLRAEHLAGERARKHKMVADLGRAAMLSRSVNEVLTQAMAIVRDGLQVDVVTFLERQPSGDFVIRGGSTTADGTAVPGNLSSPAGFAIDADAAVVMADPASEARFALPDIPHYKGVRSAGCVVIRTATGAWGVLEAAALEIRPFDADDVAFLRSVANVVAAAIERNRVDADLRRMSADRGRLVVEALNAADRERARIAGALHDDALQTLLFARQELGEIPDDERARRTLAAIDSSSRAIRTLISEIHPVVLANAGLAAALRAIAAEQARRASLQVTVRVDAASVGWHDRLIVAFTRELLANVAKHAAATAAGVMVERARAAVILTVTDNGRGITPAAVECAVADGHIGLATCLHRARSIGGQGRVEALPSGGTRVTLELPVD